MKKASLGGDVRREGHATNSRVYWEEKKGEEGEEGRKKKRRKQLVVEGGLRDGGGT